MKQGQSALLPTVTLPNWKFRGKASPKGAHCDVGSGIDEVPLEDEKALVLDGDRGEDIEHTM